MVRTVDEEKCWCCGRVTNYYSEYTGRYCHRCSPFGSSLKYFTDGLFNDDRECSCVTSSSDEPLIDHSHDIDAHRVKKCDQFIANV